MEPYRLRICRYPEKPYSVTLRQPRTISSSWSSLDFCGVEATRVVKPNTNMSCKVEDTCWRGSVERLLPAFRRLCCLMCPPFELVHECGLV